MGSGRGLTPRQNAERQTEKALSDNAKQSGYGGGR